MRRVRIGIIGAGALTEGAILPVLSGPDAMAPLDNGAWWMRRPSAQTDIQYQAPVRPEVVALAESDAVRGARVAHAARVRSLYQDWRDMVREAQIDVLICASSVETNLHVLSTLALGGLRHSIDAMWICGPPAGSSAHALELSRLPSLGKVWCARPLRYAAAHRTARRLIERSEIDEVTSLALRWPAPFFDEAASAEESSAAYALASNYAALDLLLLFGNLQPLRGKSAAKETITTAQTVQQVTAYRNGGATNMLLRFHHGLSATATFVAAEEWSAPWPRLEICGSDGRSLVAEGGRQLQLFEPREPTRVLSPPGISPLISAANLLGVAEDLKLFLTSWSESLEEPVSVERQDVRNLSNLRQAAAALQFVEAAQEAARNGQTVVLAGLAGEAETASQDEVPIIMPPEIASSNRSLPLLFD
jgi:predicted dehydrogenase